MRVFLFTLICLSPLFAVAESFVGGKINVELDLFPAEHNPHEGLVDVIVAGSPVDFNKAWKACSLNIIDVEPGTITRIKTGTVFQVTRVVGRGPDQAIHLYFDDNTFLYCSGSGSMELTKDIIESSIPEIIVNLSPSVGIPTGGRTEATSEQPQPLK